MIRRQLRAGLIAVLVCLAPGRSFAAEIDITGVYRCEGTNPDGSSYQGLVRIIREDETYQVRWHKGDRIISLGVGLVRDDLLSVSYVASGNIGVIVYRIKKGPQLDGEWTILGASDKVLSETLTKLGMSVSNDADPDEWREAAVPAQQE
jgi:hypothetical protein